MNSCIYKLKDIIDFKNGKGHENVVVEEGKYILITSKAISTNLSNYRTTNEQLTPLYIDDITMVMSDLPNGKALAKCFLIDSDDKYTLNQRICSLTVKNRNLVLPKYLYYILDRNPKLLSYDNGVDQTNLRKDDILNLEVYIPDIQRQLEIIDKLEKLKRIGNLLLIELENRIQQKNYWMNKLFTFNDYDVKKLGDFSEIKTGKGITKADAIEGGEYPIISGGIEPMGYYKESNRKGNTVTISRVGANAGFVNYIDKDFYLNDKCFSVIPTIEINPKFLYLSLKQKEDEIMKLQSEGGVPTINTTKVANIVINIPSLKFQNDIVNKFNAFDGLIKKLQIEIEQRNIQYEFYKNKLIDNKEEYYE